MKRLFLFLLAISLLAGCASTPQTPQTMPPTLPAVTVGESHTEFPGVALQIVDLKREEKKTTLSVLWRNETDYDVTYGASYEIQRLEGDVWVSCAMREDIAFNLLAYCLMSGQSNTEIYDLTGLYDITQPGTYRFVTDCFVYNDPEASTKCQLSAEFAVADPPVSLVFHAPPKLTLATPSGEATLKASDYNWTVHQEDGTSVNTITDISSRPPEEDLLEPILVNTKYAETIYAPVSSGSTYEATNSLGYLIKVNWEAAPDKIQYTCWPTCIWEDPKTPEEEVILFEDNAFYAWTGSYIYEITATWKTSGYEGTATYFVYIMEVSNCIVEEPPVIGYCGNTQTTLHLKDGDHTFWGGNSVTLTDLLLHLDYDPDRICRCMPEFTVDTEFGTGYGIHLSQGYARCEKGQAALTEEQIQTIRQILQWAEEGNCS